MLHHLFNCIRYTAANGRVIVNAVERIWKETVMDCIKELSQYLPEKYGRNHEKRFRIAELYARY
jgi:hypothetical protein